MEERELASSGHALEAQKARAEAEAIAKKAEEALAQANARAEAERQARAQAEERAKAEAVARVMQEQQLRAKSEDEIKARVQAEIKERERAEMEAEARYRQEAAARAKAAAEERRKREEEAKTAAVPARVRKATNWPVVIGIGRLEQPLGRAADAQPGKGRQRHLPPQRASDGDRLDHAGASRPLSLASASGSALAQ